MDLVGAVMLHLACMMADKSRVILVAARRSTLQRWLSVMLVRNLFLFCSHIQYTLSRTNSPFVSLCISSKEIWSFPGSNKSLKGRGCFLRTGTLHFDKFELQTFFHFLYIFRKGVFKLRHLNFQVST